MSDHPDLGWADPVGTHGRLSAAVTALAEGKLKIDQRYKKATDALVHLHARDFPAHLRSCAEEVLGIRLEAAITVGDYTHFAFSIMKPTRRSKFVRDLIALHEACLIDIGRSRRWDDIVYPSG